MFKLATDLSATKNRSYFSTESIEESIQPIQYQNDNCSMFIKNLTLLSSAEHVHLGEKIIYHNNRITIKVNLTFIESVCTCYINWVFWPLFLLNESVRVHI